MVDHCMRKELSTIVSRMQDFHANVSHVFTLRHYATPLNSAHLVQT